MKNSWPGLSRTSANILRLHAIIRTYEVRIADVYRTLGATNGIGQHRHDGLWNVDWLDGVSVF